jgi:hypothetical protein
MLLPLLSTAHLMYQPKRKNNRARPYNYFKDIGKRLSIVHFSFLKIIQQTAFLIQSYMFWMVNISSCYQSEQELIGNEIEDVIIVGISTSNFNVDRHYDDTTSVDTYDKEVVTKAMINPKGTYKPE